MLTKQQLLNIEGGKISAAWINGMIRGINTIADLGRTVGSAIRRISANRYCSF